MKNADKPIYPFNEIDWNRSSSEVTTYYSQESGLTKREYFAGLAMQGLLALPDKGTYGSFDEAIERICEVSVKFADELLEQLEENE